MHMPLIAERLADPEVQLLGIIHIAFSTGSREKVLSLTEELRRIGCAVVSEPRVTGDGYFESCILDPEGNRVEITE
jgi:lactoylglutathione lyase